MATLQDYRDERLRKLAELKELGINPYPAKSYRTHMAGEITSNFDEREGDMAVVAGRVIGIRKFGKLAFIVVKDNTGSIQLFLHAPDVAELQPEQGIVGMKQLPLLDTGDFVEATGEIVRTKTGEISVAVKSLRLLTKALRPMPTELTNKEERFRRRYVDMNVNQDVHDRFVRRSKFWQATREFMNEQGFLEINIPVLETTAGGADANPFVTHMDALDQDFYLRISHELPLKRLLVAGYEKVYDNGARFRNENYTDEHLPEHVALEWYWAYADWQSGRAFMTDMFRYVYKKVYGKLNFKLNGLNVDLAKDWPEIDYAKAIKDSYNLDIFNCGLADIKKALKANKLEVVKSDNLGKGIDKL